MPETLFFVYISAPTAALSACCRPTGSVRRTRRPVCKTPVPPRRSPRVIGRLDGLLQLHLLGIGHSGAHLAAAVHIVVAVAHQQQQHIVLAQAPIGAQLFCGLLRCPAGNTVHRGYRDRCVIPAVPIAVVLPDLILCLFGQHPRLIADPLVVFHLRQRHRLLGDVAGLTALADAHGGGDGQHQHRQCNAPLFEKLHTNSPSRRR